MYICTYIHIYVYIYVCSYFDRRLFRRGGCAADGWCWLYYDSNIRVTSPFPLRWGTHTLWLIYTIRDSISIVRDSYTFSKRHVGVTSSPRKRRYSLSHLRWDFSKALSKVKAQSSNVSFHWNVAKEMLEISDVTFERAFKNVTTGGIGCRYSLWLAYILCDSMIRDSYTYSDRHVGVTFPSFLCWGTYTLWLVYIVRDSISIVHDSYTYYSRHVRVASPFPQLRCVCSWIGLCIYTWGIVDFHPILLLLRWICMGGWIKGGGGAGWWGGGGGDGLLRF